jgi:hypothetical protein
MPFIYMTDYNVYLFNGIVALVYIGYIAVFAGIVTIDKTYIRNFSILIQLGVCLFLIYRFFPYYKTHVLTRLDVSIIYYCATFMLLNVVITEAYVAFLQGTIVSKYIDNAINDTV